MTSSSSHTPSKTCKTHQTELTRRRKELGSRSTLNQGDEAFKHKHVRRTEIEEEQEFKLLSLQFPLSQQWQYRDLNQNLSCNTGLQQTAEHLEITSPTNEDQPQDLYTQRPFRSSVRTRNLENQSEDWEQAQRFQGVFSALSPQNPLGTACY